MINPIYRFELGIKGESLHAAYPIYKDDLALETSRENNQQFYRSKLSGKLTFVGPDFEWLNPKLIDTCFSIVVYISYDLGGSWTEYWKGQFWKTDCEIDEDSKTCVVTPDVDDEYVNILNKQENEYDLIKLAPEIIPVKYDRRPMIQVYIAGQNVVGCFLAGMWWEQEVTDPISRQSDLEALHFNQIVKKIVFTKDENSVQFPLVPDYFFGKAPDSFDEEYSFINGDFTLERYIPSGEIYATKHRIKYQGTTYWEAGSIGLDGRITFTPAAGSGASGNVSFGVTYFDVYGRFICDVDDVNGVPTYDIPAEDLVADNKNYHKCIGYQSETVVFTDRLVATPTEYGIFQPGLYYAQPQQPLYYGEYYPCARNSWNWYSVWFRPDFTDYLWEEAGRGGFILKDAFSLASSIKVLLNEIDPAISFAETTDYSQFLFGSQNPISGISQKLIIVPKSNVIKAGYDQPAQKAPVTLKTILDMLRDCFRCYWFIENGKFRIEHISYFMRGGSYTAQQIIGRDLTEEIVTRNGKEWSFAKGAYSFDKLATAARYQFGWMDDVTQYFEGFPINILAGYVNQSEVEEVTVSEFTSDIDYILLNPDEINTDGFVLLAAVSDGYGSWELPYLDFIINNTSHVLQNAYAAFIFLQNYYRFDMPAYHYEINGENYLAYGIKKIKLQEITFPCIHDPSVYQLVKTSLGNGTIQKISINLHSRSGKGTLEFEPE